MRPELVFVEQYVNVVNCVQTERYIVFNNFLSSQ
jgi:hypothetical protein